MQKRRRNKGKWTTTFPPYPIVIAQDGGPHVGMLEIRKCDFMVKELTHWSQ